MTDNIRVVARFRPINKREMEEGDGVGGSRVIVKFKGDTMLDLENHQNPELKSHTFNFDQVIPMDWTQEQVYNASAKSMLEDVFNGVNATVFSYGQTGAGKSFSMMGKINDPILKGIVPRLVEDVFLRMAESPDVEFTVKLSYVEIYNEQIRDLLDTTKTQLKVRSSGNTVWVEGASQEYVKSIEDVYELINRGANSRAISSTLMNSESSRSHTIVLMTIGQKSSKGIVGAKLTLIDLAGSERVGKTGASGDTLKEAQNINKSLSALGNVINALSTVPKKGEKPYIPYRESKLTWLLSDSLGGTSKTLLIIAASPCLFNLPETYSTCLFGQRCKTIKNKVVVNQHLSESEYQRLLAMKDQHIMMLANILGDTYNQLTQLYSNVSQVNVDKNEQVSTELTTDQRGQIAYIPHTTKHTSWEQFLLEYKPPAIDVPYVLTSVKQGKDLEKAFKDLNTDELTEIDTTNLSLSTRNSMTHSSITSPSSPASNEPIFDSYLSIDPELDLPPFSGTSSTLMNDDTDESTSTSPFDPDLLADIDSPLFQDNAAMVLHNTDAEFKQQMDELNELAKQAASLAQHAQQSPQNGSIALENNDLRHSTSSTSIQSITALSKDNSNSHLRARTSSVELAAEQLKMLSLSGASQDEVNGVGNFSPTDQILSLLRSKLLEDNLHTQELLDALLFSSGTGDNILERFTVALKNETPDEEKVVKRKIVKKKTLPAATPSINVYNTYNNVEGEKGADSGDKPDEIVQEKPKTAEISSGAEDKKPIKKIVKVIKKVVKKGTKPETVEQTNDTEVVQSPQDESVADPAALDVYEAPTELVSDKVLQVAEISAAVEPVTKIAETQEKPISTPVEDIQAEPKFIVEIQPVQPTSDELFANTATANFATYSPITSDTEAGKASDEDDEPIQQSPTVKTISFDDDVDDDYSLQIDTLDLEALTLQQQERKLSTSSNSSQDSKISLSSEHEDHELTEKIDPFLTNLEFLTAKSQVEELQRQLTESQLHVQSLKLQNSLMKEQQEDILLQHEQKQHQTHAPAPAQSSVTEMQHKQVLVQNDALAIALERKCRDLVKSEVRLSACFAHIELLESQYQSNQLQSIQEKKKLLEELSATQSRATSVDALSQQLLKSANYWKQKAEHSKTLLDQQAVQLQQHQQHQQQQPNSNKPRINTPTNQPPRANSTYQLPPNRANMAQYANQGDMKNFF